MLLVAVRHSPDLSAEQARDKVHAALVAAGIDFAVAINPVG